jgi:GT2 family glycosyltransferase
MFGLKPWGGKRFMELAPSNGEVTVEKLLVAECNIITSGTVVKRDCVLSVGGFDEDREILAEDFDLWIRIKKTVLELATSEKFYLVIALLQEAFPVIL